MYHRIRKTVPYLNNSVTNKNIYKDYTELGLEIFLIYYLQHDWPCSHKI